MLEKFHLSIPFDDPEGAEIFTTVFVDTGPRFLLPSVIFFFW